MRLECATFILHLIHPTNRIFSLTCWPLCVHVCVSVILPPSLNLPLLSLWDWAGSDGVNALSLGVRVAYTHYLRNELISWYSATACDRPGNLKPQRISLSRVWNLSHGGGSLQGKSCRAFFFPSWQFSRPLNCTKSDRRPGNGFIY